jgi:hypothetical protein
VLKSVPRHVGKYRILGILDDGDAAAFFDRREPCGPVVERSRENHTDNPWAVGARRGAKRSIDCRPYVVFFGTSDDSDGAIA